MRKMKKKGEKEDEEGGRGGGKGWEKEYKGKEKKEGGKGKSEKEGGEKCCNLHGICERQTTADECICHNAREMFQYGQSCNSHYPPECTLLCLGPQACSLSSSGKWRVAASQSPPSPRLF